jgi:hypothetical protein
MMKNIIGAGITDKTLGNNVVILMLVGKDGSFIEENY